MKTVLAWAGGFVILLYVLGAFGVGNFVLIYGPDQISCSKGSE